jgi:hypothetical protein
LPLPQEQTAFCSSVRLIPTFGRLETKMCACFKRKAAD